MNKNEPTSEDCPLCGGEGCTREYGYNYVHDFPCEFCNRTGKVTKRTRDILTGNFDFMLKNHSADDSEKVGE